MALEMFYDDDADLSIIQGRKVGVIGYGSQGHAHSLSLRDSGVQVRVGLKEGSKSRDKVEEQGLDRRYPGRGGQVGRRDHAAGSRHGAGRHFQERHRAATSKHGDALFFGHGLNIHFDLIKPPGNVTIAMVAPKGPGHLVRRQFVDGKGVPAPDRRRPGPDRRRRGAGAVLRQGDRRHPRRRHQDHLQGRDRDRPVR